MIRDIYLTEGWTSRAWTWHEAADVRIFRPMPVSVSKGDLVWVGNWGDEERSAELHEFLLQPVKELKLKATIHGVRYPRKALEALEAAGINYGGWLPNFEAPDAFSSYKFTVHVPRRPYVKALPGIPTIRVFEALACGIPLISSPWDDREHLFTPGEDFLVAKNGQEMKKHMRTILEDKETASALVKHGLDTIKSRHTCAHRVDELMAIYDELHSGRKKSAASRETVTAGKAG
jgi:spore maturation protein CgeB